LKWFGECVESEEKLKERRKKSRRMGGKGRNGKDRTFVTNEVNIYQTNPESVCSFFFSLVVRRFACWILV